MAWVKDLLVYGAGNKEILYDIVALDMLEGNTISSPLIPYVKYSVGGKDGETKTFEGLKVETKGAVTWIKAR